MYPPAKGGGTMSDYELLSLIVQLGILIVSIIALVINKKDYPSRK